MIYTDKGSQSPAAALRLTGTHNISISVSAKGCFGKTQLWRAFYSTLRHELVLNDDAKTPEQPSN
jgi:hypothetical protein